MKLYFDLVDPLLEKYNVPTKAILQQIHLLSNQMQIILSHSEELTAKSKPQKKHVSEIKAAMHEAAGIMHKIQNLAQAHIEESKV